MGVFIDEDLDEPELVQSGRVDTGYLDTGSDGRLLVFIKLDKCNDVTGGFRWSEFHDDCEEIRGRLHLVGNVIVGHKCQYRISFICRYRMNLTLYLITP